MAEILIQRKRRRSRWPWVLGLVALVLLPLSLLNDREEQTVATATTRRDTTVRRDTAARVDSAGPVTSSAAARDTAARVTSSSAGSVERPPNGGVAPAPAAPLPATPRPDSARISPSTPTSPNRTASSAARSTAPAGARGGAFARFIATTRPAAGERGLAEYTADALLRLTTDLRTLGVRDAGVWPIRAYADSLRLPNTWDGAQADFARAAFLGAVHQLDGLRARTRARVDVPRLREIAWQLDARRPLGPQRATVDRFFAAAREALDSLSRRR